MSEQTPVYLKKQYIVPTTGNRYPRGKYALESLPVAIREDKNYIEHINKVKEVDTTERERVLNPSKDAVKKLNRTEYVFEADLPVNVNDATLEELVNVQGIGKKTALNIIANRPYKDIADLKARANTKRFKPEDINITVAPPKAHTEVTGMKVVERKLDIPQNTEAARRKKRTEVLEDRKLEKTKLLSDYAKTIEEKTPDSE